MSRFEGAVERIALVTWWVGPLSQRGANKMESSLSLEETNKIRISLGLKPLVDDGAPADVKEKAAEDNYAERRERENAERRTRFGDS